MVKIRLWGLPDEIEDALTLHTAEAVGFLGR